MPQQINPLLGPHKFVSATLLLLYGRRLAMFESAGSIHMSVIKMSKCQKLGPGVFREHEAPHGSIMAYRPYGLAAEDEGSLVKPVGTESDPKWIEGGRSAIKASCIAKTANMTLGGK